MLVSGPNVLSESPSGSAIECSLYKKLGQQNNMFKALFIEHGITEDPCYNDSVCYQRFCC